MIIEYDVCPNIYVWLVEGVGGGGGVTSRIIEEKNNYLNIFSETMKRIKLKLGIHIYGIDLLEWKQTKFLFTP